MLERILGKDIASYVKDHRGFLVCAIILTAISSLFVVVPAYLLQPFIDEGMKTGSDPVSWKIPWLDFGTGSIFTWHRTELVVVKEIAPNLLLLLLTAIAFVSVIFKSLTNYLGQLAAAAFSNRAVKSLRIDFLNKLISLDQGFYNKHKAGGLISRSTADLSVMQSNIANIIIGLVQHPLTAIVFLAFLMLMNYKLSLIIFVAAPLIVGLIRVFGRKVKKHSTRIMDATSEVTFIYYETLLCLKVIQGFCMERIQSKKFQELADQLYKKVMRWSRWSLGLGPMMDISVFLILPVVFITGKIYFHHTLGELISMFYAFSRFYAPVKSIGNINNDLRSLQGSTERVFGIIKTVPDIREKPGAENLPRHTESVEFRNVTLYYQSGIPILKNISFRINRGEIAAFVGSTGAGKSSLLDLIPRFYDVTDGAILIDGVDIRDVTLESLRRQIGIVSQEVLLFHDTIANNISLGSSAFNMDSIHKAAKTAYAHDFITKQPKGYKTMVGDRGTLLSGGQKQRIAIARAILSHPSILLLDEVASALDAESERYIQDAIEALRKEITIFVVAHRLSTIRNADRIFVLEEGRIVESGSHKDLMELNGRFRQLYNMQFQE
jgi:ATP-binding cassette, subfamily B, bacterial MsbA